ncbi:winged helix DNA-binding protein [Poritiphilus flavus]|uniref:Winged helix DNA-binding protein n=1 Tax=Poritiphilus flavus TaxID=2697053 RepID=A0A6L9EGU9_9FLAO|nr:winged helix DNA-binding protein [Poritiphilus flavus]NAS13748.1 winged helix DNA-binding protein [Poritiphilus flavus]
MDVYGLTKELVLLVGEFKKEQQEGKNDLNTFLDWLDSRRNQNSETQTYSITGHSIEAELAAYIGRLSRYSNSYIKMTLEGLPFSTDMDFKFTVILDGARQVGKTDLIRMLAYDKSTGMGVIRRLLEKGIIEEFPNPDDKRGKLLRLTDDGKNAIQLGYQKVGRAANLVARNLNQKEKQKLLYLLKKLDDFHYPIYLNETQDQYL